MATKKITNDNHEFDIDKKSVTYALDSNLSDSTNILLNFVSGDGEHPNYMMRLRNRNDLVVQYSTNDGHDNYGKIITTTIKNFFLTTYSGKVLFNGSLDLNKTTDYQPNFRLVVNDKTIFDTEYTFIYGSSKKNTYILSSNGNVIDPSGNDTYKMASTSNANIWDFKGNDNYDYTGVTSSNITDEKGNDKYILKSGSAISNLKEKAGNDTYTVVGSSLKKLEDVKGKDKYTVTGGTLTVQDDAGNDTYKITESSTNIEDYGKSNDSYTLTDVSYSGNENYGIIDNGGKDKYSFVAVDGNGDAGDTFWVADKAGNDSYSLGALNNVMIQDGGASEVSGNDTYKLKEVSGISIIKDFGGNNKFTVTDSAFVKDTFGIGELVIRSYGTGQDKKNNDTYTFKNVEGAWYTMQEQEDGNLPEQTLQESIQIFDDAGNDKFTFTEVNWANIRTYTNDISEDSKKSDSNTYTLKKTMNTDIESWGRSNDKYTITSSDSICISDTKGDDKYTITSSDVIINDSNGNDTYTLKKLDNTSVVITDTNSDKDKLVISGEKYDKTKGVIAVASGYGDSPACNLHLYDTQTGDFATISNFYSVTGNEIKGEGSGCIETVKIGSKTIKLTDDQFMAGLNQLNSAVSGWLSAAGHTGYENVDDVFAKGNETDIANLVATVFQGNSAS